MAEYFFSKLEGVDYNSLFIEGVKLYANSQKQQIYVISSPLTDNKYNYGFHGGYILMMSKGKIAFLCCSEDEDAFEEFCDDVLDDISSISDKYQFRDVIGRKRKWEDLFIRIKEPLDNDFESFYNENLSTSQEYYRTIDILISLLIGSINDAKRITTVAPENILDKVKKKIQLFDTDQSRFIYEDRDPNQKIIHIQGLSGTGKTELLLHKLKDLYTQDDKSKICITCHNKVLAHSLRKRIPEFFNFMKVERQIEWNSRLWCVNAWGSSGDENSGALRYICSFYDIPFLTLREAGSFRIACEYAIEKIKEEQNSLEKQKYAYTYMLVDECQDFNDAFFKLCSLVTEKRIYIAGDIFQSIFDNRVDTNIKSDYLLSRCYRTDPKTLMFAQGLGMGLFEEKKLWWLEKDMWELCGYNVELKNNGYIYELTREPIKRFEDVSSDFDSLRIIESLKIGEEIIGLLKKLKIEFPNVEPSDIGIIFLDNANYVYEFAPQLGMAIQKYLGWNYNIAHESKTKIPNSVFISNRNNVKGLEFPFVFCVTKKIIRDYSYRNALYTMISRSFLRTYLMILKGDDNGLIDSVRKGAKDILTNKKMSVVVPSKEEKIEIEHEFKVASSQKPLRERVELIMKDLKFNDISIDFILEMVKYFGGKNFGDSELTELIHSIRDKKYESINNDKARNL